MYRVFAGVLLLSVTSFSYADLNCQDPSYQRDPDVAKYCQSINNVTQSAQRQYESQFSTEQLNRLNQFGPNVNTNTSNNNTTSNTSQTNTNNTNQTQQSSSPANTNNGQNSGSSVNYY